MQFLITIDDQHADALLDWLNDNAAPDRRQPGGPIARQVVVPDDGGFAYLENVQEWYERYQPRILAERFGNAPVKRWDQLTTEQQLLIAEEIAMIPEWCYPEMGSFEYYPSEQVCDFIFASAA